MKKFYFIKTERKSRSGNVELFCVSQNVFTVTLFPPFVDILRSKFAKPRQVPYLLGFTEFGSFGIAL